MKENIIKYYNLIDELYLMKNWKLKMAFLQLSFVNKM